MFMQLFALKDSADYYTHPPGIVSFNCIPAISLHIHTQGRFNNHTVNSLYRTVVMATSVVGLMKMGNIMPKAGIKTTSQEFRTSVLTITPRRLP